MNADPIVTELREWVERSRKTQGLDATVQDVKALRTIVQLLNKEEE